MPHPFLTMLPSGTSANEALHANVKNAFRQVRTIHKATLEVKAQILTLAKLIEHNAGMYHDTSRQMLPSVILGRVSAISKWTDASWASWCSELERSGVAPPKAVVPLVDEKHQQVHRVRQWVLKHPAAAPDAGPRRRTAFTKTHSGRLVSSAVPRPAYAARPVAAARKPRQAAVLKRPVALKRPAAARP